MIGRHRLVFVPRVRVTVRPDALRVRLGKKLVGEGPSIDTDGELFADAEPEVFSHYGMPTGNDGVRRLARR
jgi:hypothetical protein